MKVESERLQAKIVESKAAQHTAKERLDTATSLLPIRPQAQKAGADVAAPVAQELAATPVQIQATNPITFGDAAAIAARIRLQTALDQLNPAGGIQDQGDGSGRHANKVKKKKTK